MTDREFKRLSRSQLIEIIYQFQLKQDELIAENARLAKALEEKRLRIEQAGNIAEAALAVNHVMQAAQNAAQQYLDEIRMRHSELDVECERIRSKALAEAAEILAGAQKEAAAITQRCGKQENTPAKLREEKPAVPAKTVETHVEVPVHEEEPASILENAKREEDALLEDILSEFGSMSEL